jgi:hypothetical protein
MAGESAQREYERRRVKDAERRRRAWPVLGAFVILVAALGYLLGEQMSPGSGQGAALLFGVLTALKLGAELAPRQSTVSWKTGSAGERKVANWIDAQARFGWRALHDRLVPGRRSNIDHVAVGPGGVFVVDAKAYNGRLTVRRGQLRIAGRDCTKLLTQVTNQAAVVSARLATAGISAPPVRPVLCFVGTELPRRRLQVNGVEIVGRRGLQGQLLTGRHTGLTSHQIDRIVDCLQRELKPA